MHASRHGPDRRELLAWLGASAGWVALASGCTSRSASLRSSFVGAGGVPSWTSVLLPLPIGSDGGDAAGDAQRLARFEVRDELVVPPEFEWDLLATYGERFGPAGSELAFGFNNDFLGLVPLAGSESEALLVVNHESVSPRPWLAALRESLSPDAPRFEVARDEKGVLRVSLDGHVWSGEKLELAAATRDSRLLAQLRSLSERALGDMGISVLHVRRSADGRWSVVRDSCLHRRLRGNAAHLATHSNCSGCVTPWATALSGEENYQDYAPEFVDAAGEPLARDMAFELIGIDPRLPEPFEINGFGSFLAEAQDGRDFGWVVHVDPSSGELRKLRQLGRMRHENVALRVEVGAPLVAYTGDDRRGGHVWKFVSSRLVERSDDPRNVELFEEGTLHVARFSADGTGEWLPLLPSAPLVRPRPETTGGGHLWLPDRSSLRAEGKLGGGWIAVSAPHAKKQGLSAEAWCQSVERFCGRPFEQLTLGDLVARPATTDAAFDHELHVQRVLLLDAVAMANAIGATPCARPEDIELHPHDGSVFVSFSDFTSLSSEGSPDASVFEHARASSSRRYGAIYRLEELGDDALRFRWSSFCSSGELADGGAGFANPNNLCFNPDGNLWVLTDISSLGLNSAVTREGDSAPGQDRFAGVFGSSALFFVPTRGPSAGIPRCFALGPSECELCGVTFSPDGETLFLSVQHPGELHGTRGRPGSGLPTTVERKVLVAARDGTLFEQLRTVPIGSNWPSGQLGTAPRPAVVAIRRRATAPGNSAG
ncbi:MAG: PhoX family protein [Planctomycetota bacterium]